MCSGLTGHALEKKILILKEKDLIPFRAKQKKKETVQVLTHEFKRIIVEKQGPRHLTPLVGHAPEPWALCKEKYHSG